jgi:DNA-binding MarR family transcriptional regulator
MIEHLQNLGFSQYEAQAYIALLHESPLNGYELARASGIPRPNIYPVLQKLEERGAVLRLDSTDGTRYTPVSPDELLASLSRRYKTSLDAASNSLQQIAAAPRLEYILNLRGYPVLLEHARTLLQNTQRHLLLSLWHEEAAALADLTQQAVERGVQITTLCLRGCPRPCPDCRGSVFRYPMAPAQASRWLVLVSDEDELLAGEITPPPADASGGMPAAYAVRTRQSMLVNLSAGYIQNSIALASILTSLGDRLHTTLDPQSIDALNTLHPLNTQGQWIENMQRLLAPHAGSVE